MRSIIAASFAILVLAVSGVRADEFSLLTWNVAGNRVNDWTTNSVQVQAIGAVLQALDPDIVTFNEIPYKHSTEMTNFVTAFMPEHELAMNSGTDGFIRSAILSRFPILNSQRHLARTNLTWFGIDANFSRDLFETEIEVPGFDDPVHIFTTHLKALGDSTSSQRRGAEGLAISNFFTTVFQPARPERLYVLAGDMNEDVDEPYSNSLDPLNRIANETTGLHLTRPVDPMTGDARTWSARDRLTIRFDYILPCTALSTNIQSSFVHSSDLTATASDHLPIMMTFHDPDDVSEPNLAISKNDDLVNLRWSTLEDSINRLESSPNLKEWNIVEDELLSTSGTIDYSSTTTAERLFFRLTQTR